MPKLAYVKPREEEFRDTTNLLGVRVQFAPEDVFGEDAAEGCGGKLVCGTVSAIEWNYKGAFVDLDDEWSHLSPDKEPVRVAMDKLERES